MKLSDFDFQLPEELIAQHPAEKRDTSRLMVLHKNTGEIEHKHFYDIIDYLHPGDVLVRNNSKVDRKSTRLNPSHRLTSRMPSSA